MEPSAIKQTAIKVGRVLLWLVYIWVAITLVLLFLSFLLQLFGANPTAGFLEWVYRSTAAGDGSIPRHLRVGHAVGPVRA